MMIMTKRRGGQLPRYRNTRYLGTVEGSISGGSCQKFCASALESCSSLDLPCLALFLHTSFLRLSCPALRLPVDRCLRPRVCARAS